MLTAIVGIAFILALGMVAALVWLIWKSKNDAATLQDMQDLYEQGEEIKNRQGVIATLIEETLAVIKAGKVEAPSNGNGNGNGNGHREVNFLDAIADLQKAQAPEPVAVAAEEQPGNLPTPDEQQAARDRMAKARAARGKK